MSFKKIFKRSQKLSSIVFVSLKNRKLFDDFFSAMYESGADFTNSFRKLSELNTSGRHSIDDDIKIYLKVILKQCNSIAEMKSFCKPMFPKE